jgi:hypothetical protein
MQQQNDIAIYILEHLGLPLMQASSVLNAQDKKADAEACANIMAKLLSSSVQLGMAYSGKMNVPSDPDKGEVIRFKLTSIAAQALLGRVSLTKKEPVDADIDMLKAASDSLLAFSENFSLNERSHEVLKSLELDLFSGEELSYLHMVEAMLPVVEAVGAKPLQGDAAQLIQQVTDRLKADSQGLVQGLGISDDTGFAGQRAFSILAKVFAGSYRDAVTQKQNLESVWTSYETQKDLALVLLKYLVTGQTQAAPQPQQPVQTPLQETPQAAVPPPSSPVAEAPAALPTQSVQEPPPAPPADAGSSAPSIFGKPSDDAGQTISPPPPQQPEAPQQPVENAVPPPPPQKETTAQQAEEGSTEGGDGDSPLSFFKKSDS